MKQYLVISPNVEQYVIMDSLEAANNFYEAGIKNGFPKLFLCEIVKESTK